MFCIMSLTVLIIPFKILWWDIISVVTVFLVSHIYFYNECYLILENETYHIQTKSIPKHTNVFFYSSEGGDVTKMYEPLSTTHVRVVYHGKDTLTEKIEKLSYITGKSGEFFKIQLPEKKESIYIPNGPRDYWLLDRLLQDFNKSFVYNAYPADNRQFSASIGSLNSTFSSDEFRFRMRRASVVPCWTMINEKNVL